MISKETLKLGFLITNRMQCIVFKTKKFSAFFEIKELGMQKLSNL